jgi:hypothetical protein
MTSLLIKDLTLAKALDRQAARAVRGGTSVLYNPGPSGPSGPSGPCGPAGGAGNPWGSPTLHTYPALPSWMTPYLPGGAPQEPNDNTVHMS